MEKQSVRKESHPEEKKQIENTKIMDRKEDSNKGSD